MCNKSKLILFFSWTLRHNFLKSFFKNRLARKPCIGKFWSYPSERQGLVYKYETGSMKFTKRLNFAFKSSLEELEDTISWISWNVVYLHHPQIKTNKSISTLLYNRFRGQQWQGGSPGAESVSWIKPRYLNSLG